MNLMDVALSQALFSSGYAYEANPAAQFVIQHWGFLGMSVYKVSVVVLVIGVVAIIARLRISTARRVMRCGSLMVGSVVAYSAALLAAFGLGW